jgi:hypothetical protein
LSSPTLTVEIDRPDGEAQDLGADKAAQMFEQLTEKLQKTLKYIWGEGKITEKNVAEALS